MSKFTSNKKILSKVVALSYNKFYCQILFFIKDDLLFLVILACLHKGSRSLNKFLLQKKIIIKNNVHNFVKKWPDIVTIFFFFFLRWDFKGNRECKNKINYNKMEKIKYLWQMNFWDEIFKWYRFWQMRLIYSWCKLIGGTWFAQNKIQIKSKKNLPCSIKKKILRRELWILNERKSILNYEGTTLFEK